MFTPLEYGVVGASEDEAIQRFDEDSIEVNTVIPTQNTMHY